MTPIVRDAATLSPVQGTLLNPVVEDDLNEAHKLWPPVLRLVLAEQIAAGGNPNIKIWQGNWGQKVLQLGQVDTSIQGIKVNGRVQGLIKLLVQGQSAWLALGKEVVYVDLVESAPWNVQRYMNVLGRKTIYKDVGIELMRAAVDESVSRGFEGRVGLHSIPRAETFYEGIGMTRVGADASKGNLVYFEFEADDATGFFGDRR